MRLKWSVSPLCSWKWRPNCFNNQQDAWLFTSHCEKGHILNHPGLLLLPTTAAWLWSSEAGVQVRALRRFAWKAAPASPKKKQPFGCIAISKAHFRFYPRHPQSTYPSELRSVWGILSSAASLACMMLWACIHLNIKRGWLDALKFEKASYTPGCECELLVSYYLWTRDVTKTMMAMHAGRIRVQYNFRHPIWQQHLCHGGLVLWLPFRLRLLARVLAPPP